MSQLTHYPESMSGPRERIVAADCVSCNASSEVSCDNCGEPLCRECSVSCAHCPIDTPLCVTCAAKRGYQEIDGGHFCESCSCEFEPETEMARR